MPNEVPTKQIEIPGDVLIPEAQFCQEVLAGATRRTAQRLDAEGLPFVMVAGRKFRPLNEGRQWLAKRIKRPNPPTARRPRGRKRAANA
jgi:hypothetical protein